MKLYFYFLGVFGGEIRTEECEVREKREKYIIRGYAPFGYPGKDVYKGDIGQLLISFQYYIVLKKRDAERVAKIFTCVCNSDIYQAEKAKNQYERMIDRKKETIKNIEKWRSENAGK